MILFCGVFYLETASVQTKIQTAVNTRLSGEIFWKKISISPFSGRVELEGLDLKGQDKKQLGLVKRLSVNIDWVKLLKGDVSFSSIVLESPTMTIEEDDDGTLNLVKAFQPPDPASEKPEKSSMTFPFNITIDKFVITDGSAQYRLPGKKSVSVSGVDVHGSIKDVFKTPVLDMTMTAQIPLQQLSALLPDIPGISGSVVSHIRLKGKGIDPDRLTANLGFDLTAKKFKTDAMDVPIDVEIKADAKFENNKAVLKSFTAVSEGIHLFGESEFEPLSGKLTGNLELKVDDLSSTPGLIHIKGTGGVNLSARVTGSYLSPDFRLDLKSDNLGVRDIFLGNLALTALINSNGRAVIDRLTLENQGSSITATGWADLFEDNFKLNKTLPMDLGLSFDNVELSDFSPKAGLKGVFSGSGRLTGTRTDPTALLEASGKGLSSGSYTIGDALLNLRFSQRTFFIDDLRLTNKGSLLAATGSVKMIEEDFSLMDDPEFRLSLTGGSLFLADFSDQMQGRLSVNGIVKGTFDNMSGNLDMEGSKLNLGGQTIDHFSLKTLLKGQTIHVKDLDIRVTPDAAVKGQGWASYSDKRFELSLSSQDFPLTAIDVISDTALTSGRMTMDLSCAGTIETPVINSQINIRGIEIKNEPLDDMDLTIEIKNRIARVKGQMGALLEGEYHFEDKTFLASVDMAKLDLSPYFNAAGQETFSGRMNGSITASGRVDDLPMIRATAEIKNTALRFKKNEFIHIPGLNLSMADGRFSLPEARITILGQEGIKIKGEGSFREDLFLELKGQIPFEAITPVFEDISNASGNMILSASLKGTISDPRFTGDLKLDRMGMAVLGMEQQFRGINGIIRITPDSIEIDRVSGQLDDGNFDFSGKIGLNGLTPESYDLNASAQQLFLEFPDLMDITLNTSLSLTGNRDVSNLTGEIVLLEGRYSKAIELDLAGAVEKKREVQPVQEKPAISFLEKMALNIDIRHREPFWVDNNLALLSIRPDLKLSGTAAEPVISGRAQVDSGTITFQGNEFEVRKGIIDFINPYKIEPSIDMEADLEVRSWTIYLTVSGTPDNLDFNFRSTPEEQHADILSLLAFGKTTRELRQADGGSTFSPSEILAGFVAETLQKNIKDASGLDYLEIKPDNDTQGVPGVNVVVGKDLSRQMTVKYGVDVRNGETIQRMNTDYKLLENLLLRGFQDTGGQFGGEIKYRLEFR